jgi:hypothetical protein
MGCVTVTESEQAFMRRNDRAAEIDATRPFMRPPGLKIHLFIDVFRVLRQRICSDMQAIWYDPESISER